MAQSTAGEGKRKLITIMVPVFNEEDNVERCYSQLLEDLSSLDERYDFEYLFLDNHSVDDTYEILRTLAARIVGFGSSGFQRILVFSARSTQAIRARAGMPSYKLM